LWGPKRRPPIKIYWLDKSEISTDKQLLKIVHLMLIWCPENIIHNMASGALSAQSFSKRRPFIKFNRSSSTRRSWRCSSSSRYHEVNKKEVSRVHQVAATRPIKDCPINDPDAILQIMFSGRDISVNWTIMGRDLVSATWWTVLT